jgi:hypothetical protein
MTHKPTEAEIVAAQLVRYDGVIWGLARRLVRMREDKSPSRYARVRTQLEQAKQSKIEYLERLSRERDQETL